MIDTYCIKTYFIARVSSLIGSENQYVRITFNLKIFYALRSKGMVQSQLEHVVAEVAAE